MATIIGPDKVAPEGASVIFPCGTFRGSEPWRDEAAIVLGSRSVPGFVAINDFGSHVGLHKEFNTKYAWGDHHLRRALKGGVVMFWFGKQVARIQTNTSYLYDRPFGAGADFELGRCLMWRELHPLTTRLVIGCSPEYDRKKALIERVELSTEELVPIVGTIEDVLEATVALFKQ